MDLLESKKEDYLFKIKQIELLQRRLDWYFRGLPHYRLPALDVGFVETNAGAVLPVIVYGGNKSMTLCPHCERLHDYHAAPINGTVLNCPYILEPGSRFVAMQYKDLETAKLEPGSRFDPKKDRENPVIDTKPAPAPLKASLKELINQ